MRFFLFLALSVFSVVANSEEVNIDSLLKNNTLPLVNIETVGEEWPTCERSQRPENCYGIGITNMTKVPGRIIITHQNIILYDSGEYSAEEGAESGMVIRVRGNASTLHTPMPYKIKLNKKADLLLRGNDEKYADKSWLLLKDGNLRKNIGFKISELMKLQWTPSYRYVNVLFNGKYLGMYLMTESIKRNKECRLNVEKNGFIFEYDIYWWNEDLYVESEIGRSESMHYTFKYPDVEEMSDEQLAYFKEMIHTVEASLSNGTYPDYIDLDSFVSWMLGHDILGNSDGIGSNIYLTKKDDTADSKVMMANLWDCEHIFETTDEWDKAHEMFYFKELFNNKNNTFLNAYKERWREISPTIFNELIAYLDSFSLSDTAKAIDELMPLNNEISDRQYGKVDQYVEEAKSWLVRRKQWMIEAIEKIPQGIVDRSINDDQRDESYYNLQGQKVKPDRPGLYIQKGKKVFLSSSTCSFTN